MDGHLESYEGHKVADFLARIGSATLGSLGKLGRRLGGVWEVMGTRIIIIAGYPPTSLRRSTLDRRARLVGHAAAGTSARTTYGQARQAFDHEAPLQGLEHYFMVSGVVFESIFVLLVI